MVEAMVEESGGINPRIAEQAYTARFAGAVEKVLPVEKIENNQKFVEEVPRWEWFFALRQIAGKSESDIKFTMLTSPKISTKSKAYGAVKALSGGVAPELKKTFDVDSLIGKYVTLVVKDKAPKADRTGAIQITSEVKEMLPCPTPPTPEISIEGVMTEEEPDEGAAPVNHGAAQAPQPQQPPQQKSPQTKRKK